MGLPQGRREDGVKHRRHRMPAHLDSDLGKSGQPTVHPPTAMAMGRGCAATVVQQRPAGQRQVKTSPRLLAPRTFSIHRSRISASEQR